MPKITNYKTHAIKDFLLKGVLIMTFALINSKYLLKIESSQNCANICKIECILIFRKFIEHNNNFGYNNDSYSIDNNNKLIDFS